MLTLKTHETLVTPRDLAISPSQSLNRQRMAISAQAYKNLSRAAQNNWFLLGKQIKSKGKKPRPLNGYQCFCQVNAIRLASAMPLLLDAPQTPDTPGGINQASINAALASSGPLTPTRPGVALTRDPLTLTLQCGDYAGLLQITAAPPAFAGQTAFHPADFASLGTVAVTAGQPVTLSTLYLGKHGVPQSGDKIALTLYPVSDSGFRGHPLIIDGVVDGLLAHAHDTPPLSQAA